MGELFDVAVFDLLDRLTSAQFEAYLVGGAVRDGLRGLQPKDYDVTTSATPDQIKACFADRHCIDTGIQHGTVTVGWADFMVEITTYRTEQGYQDGRHPDAVQFTKSLAEDLKRRDFTVNAMAYHPDHGVVDLFGGQEDLQAQVLRAVGDPDTRFAEDALRILRGLRFASQTGFTLDPVTMQAMVRQQYRLGRVSPERKWQELRQLLLGDAVEVVLQNGRDILRTVLPSLEVVPIYDSDTLTMRMARLADLADWQAIKIDRKTARQVALLQSSVNPTASPYGMKKILQQQGILDATAVLIYHQNKQGLQLLEQILASDQCYSLSQLALTGQDLQDIGLSGRQIGDWLVRALDQVQQQTIENHREDLLRWVLTHQKNR